MTISEAKARANAKWRRENMGSITLHFRKALIKQIQEAADREGVTRDRWLKNTIRGKLMDETIVWQAGDTVTDPDTGATGTIVDAGDGENLDTMEIEFEEK